MPPKRQKLLSNSRPQPFLTQAKKAPNLSSKTTQRIISKHHTLQKQLNLAQNSADVEKAQSIQAELDANGGLKLYQQASVQGQSKERGGDTSKVLVDWLGLSPSTKTTKCLQDAPLRVLEVGALSSTNALNIPNITHVRRIDLHSQEPSIIEEGDFMAMDPDEVWQGRKGYDVVSLSLVVNYVSDPRARGAMLGHAAGFLRNKQQTLGRRRRGQTEAELLPALFLVLPLPCIENSRYLTEERLEAIMACLGYEKKRVKRSTKLYYSLWRLLSRDRRSKMGASKGVFKKTELRSGRDRNNFCIVLDPEIIEDGGHVASEGARIIDPG